MNTKQNPRIARPALRYTAWIAVAVACSCSEVSTPNSSEPELPAKAPLDPVGVVIAEPNDAAQQLFAAGQLRTFELEVAPADLERVDRDPKAEDYVPARLYFEGVRYDVGYRYKGSVGAFRPPCTAEFDGGPKAGKCSIKLSFNWKDPNAQFFGLKKLLFHAMNKDASQLRERLGYGLFRAMGVPAPRAVHAVLKVNGQAELYALVEEIDGRFTRSHFSEGGRGNLYKEIWPVHDDPQVYRAALETNADDSPSVDRMLDFKAAVKEGPEQMARWLDMDATVSYVAVDRLILNDDGAFHFYCIEGGMGNNPTLPGNHNYYWYEAEHADRLWIIPWDLDQSLRDADYPPHLPYDWRLQPSAAECQMCMSNSTGFALNGPPPGCDPVFRNFQNWQALYEAKLDELLAGPFSKAAVDAQLATWSMQIRDAGFPTNDEAVEELQAILERTRTHRGYPY